MFNKFKKFSFIFIFCMSIFGVTAFAQTNDNSRALGLDTKNYYVKYDTSNGSKTYVITFNKFSDGKILECNTYQYLDGKYTLVPELSNTDFHVGTMSNFFTDNYDLYYYLVDNGYGNPGYGSVVPPYIAPTVGEAIAKIPEDLLTQLKTLLPVGVTILSLVLGISLVPRLVRLFR